MVEQEEAKSQIEIELAKALEHEPEKKRNSSEVAENAILAEGMIRDEETALAIGRAILESATDRA